MGYFIGYVLVFFAILLIRYFTTAGFFYAYYSKVKNNKTDKKLLSQRPLKKEQVKKEIYWSVVSSAIFAFFGAVTYWLYLNDFTAVYLDASQYGYWYLPLSLLIVLLLHETYYYWVHRAMHFPKISKGQMMPSDRISPWPSRCRLFGKLKHPPRVSTPWMPAICCSTAFCTLLAMISPCRISKTSACWVPKPLVTLNMA